MWVPPGEKDMVSIENAVSSSKAWKENLGFAAGNYHRRYVMNKQVIV